MADPKDQIQNYAIEPITSLADVVKFAINAYLACPKGKVQHGEAGHTRVRNLGRSLTQNNRYNNNILLFWLITEILGKDYVVGNWSQNSFKTHLAWALQAYHQSFDNDFSYSIAEMKELHPITAGRLSFLAQKFAHNGRDKVFAPLKLNDVLIAVGNKLGIQTKNYPVSDSNSNPIRLLHSHDFYQPQQQLNFASGQVAF